MNEELVTIKTFVYDSDTILYAAQFEDAGIFYYLKDQNTIVMYPFVSNAIGGIKLQVKRTDVENAVALINEIDKHRKESDLEKEITIEDKKYELTLEECPKCGLENIYVEKLAFFKSLINSFSKKNFYCNDCKHRWEQD